MLLLVSAVLLTNLDLPPAAQPNHKIGNAAWLAGPWLSGPDQPVHFEEHWSQPVHGTMIGMFRIDQGGKPSMFEFLLLEEQADGVFLRLRHYRPQMQDIDKEPIRLKLVEAGPRKLVFENPHNDKPKRIIYAMEAPDQVTATVETTRDGKPASFSLKMVRGKEK